jgi:hypothetical protein
MLHKNTLFQTIGLLGLLGTSSLISLIVSPSSAQALTLTQFNTAASFDAATQNVDTINFSNFNSTVSAGGNTEITNPDSVTLVGTNNGSVTFGEANTANQLFVISTADYSPLFAFNYSASGADAGASLVETATGNGAGITAGAFSSSNIYAVGADILSSDGATAQNFTVTVDTLNEAAPSVFTVATQAQPTSQFIGFTSNEQILDIKFQPAAGATQITNFQFGQVKVPFELNSTLGISLLGCFWGANLLRKKLTAQLANKP